MNKKYLIFGITLLILGLAGIAPDVRPLVQKPAPENNHDGYFLFNNTVEKNELVLINYRRFF